MTIQHVNAVISVMNLIIWVTLAKILGRRIDTAHKRADLAAERLDRLERRPYVTAEDLDAARRYMDGAFDDDPRLAKATPKEIK
jgi:hypothetical protein